MRRLFSLLVLVLLVACSRAPKPEPAALLPVVTDTSSDLLFTWIDDKGEFHVEQKVADVPVSARDVVRVADPVKDPPKLDDVFVADLRNLGPAGSYSVRTMSRLEFEKAAVERRQKNGAILAAKPADSAPPAAAVAPGTQVIVYGASWCGPCHQTKAYLKQRNVPFVEKDVDEDQSASREMQAKLARVGKHGGSIPVIDVRGTILIGFDPGALDRALAAR